MVFGTKTPPGERIRCGVYLRQSDDPNGDELATSRQWDEIIEKICGPRAWEPVRYADNDRTAVGEKRSLPERDRMLRDVESGELQAIAVWDCDRLYREPIDLEHIIKIADKHRTLLATVTGDIDLGTDNGRLFARVKGAFAKAETERRSVRQKAKSKQLAEQGKNFSHKRSFGRFPDGTVHPVEAPALLEACEAYVAGHSLYSIRKQWNAQGLRTTSGKEWGTNGQLVWVLTNPRNAGYKSYHREILDEQELAFTPIVPALLFKAVCDKVGEGTPPDTSHVRFLTGIGLCGLCVAQDKVGKMRSGNSWRGLPIYQCKRCFKVRAFMQPVDEHLEGLIIGRLSKPDAVELLINQRHPDLDEKRAEASALRQKLKTIAVSWADGDMDDAQLKAATTRIKSKLAALDAALEDANRSRLFKGVVGEDAPLFPSLHVDRRKAIVEVLMTVKIERRSLREKFDEDSVHVDWHQLF